MARGYCASDDAHWETDCEAQAVPHCTGALDDIQEVLNDCDENAEGETDDDYYNCFMRAFDGDGLTLLQGQTQCERLAAGYCASGDNELGDTCLENAEIGDMF